MEKIQKLYPDGVEYGTVILVEPPAPEELGDIIEEVENGRTVMRFRWIDYCEAYEVETEKWSKDESTLKYAIDESIKADHLYYLADTDYIHNETYFCKAALEEDKIMPDTKESKERE